MNKNLLLTIALVSAALLCEAQITKGSVLLGGGISAGRGTSESGNIEGKSRSIGFYPTIGVAVKDNTVAGLRLSYYYGKASQSNPDLSQKSNSYSAGLFYRKYLPLSRAFYLFGEGAAFYASNETRNNYSPLGTNSRQTQRIIGVNLYPGVAYVVSKRFHLEVGLNNLLSLDYSRSTHENLSPGQSSISKNSGVNFSTNLSTAAPLTVGFRFVLGK